MFYSQSTLHRGICGIFLPSSLNSPRPPIILGPKVFNLYYLFCLEKFVDEISVGFSIFKFCSKKIFRLTLRVSDNDLFLNYNENIYLVYQENFPRYLPRVKSDSGQLFKTYRLYLWIISHQRS